MSVSVASSVLIVTVPLAGSGAAESIEMSASVTFPDRVSFVRGLRRYLYGAEKE